MMNAVSGKAPDLAAR